QQHGVNIGATNAKNKIDEVTIDMINYNGSDGLYNHDVYRNVKGNTLVAGGHMQNEADQPVTPTTDSNSDVAKTVQDHLVTPPQMDTNRPSHTGYQLYDSNSKNRE
ncbi:conjugal transfer protein TraG, partial [Vibrio parahaemolyticus]|nr:conjugal transfer protein TraG [Vibrio parahaemolyticus]